jgi:transposase
VDRGIAPGPLRGSFSRCRCTGNHDAGSARPVTYPETTVPHYNQPHAFYAGVDLHARTMYVHVLSAKGKTVFDQNLPSEPDAFLEAIAPYRKNLVVGCECMFAWYWLADLCMSQRIPFVLGHALAMKHIHGGKAKSDKIDAGKLAAMLRGGLFPLAYVYPREKRHTRDLLRRRSFFVRQRAQLITHIVNTNSQFNLPPFPKKLTYAGNRSAEIAERFSDPSTQLMIGADLQLIDAYDLQIAMIEKHLLKSAKVDDPVTFGFLRTIPGIGPILGLILLYEIDRIDRFPEVGNFLSYSRLVRCAHESAGKVKGHGGKKIGNAHLKWAFSEAACLMIRSCLPVKAWMQRQEQKRGKRKALSVLEAKIGRTVYHLWAKQRAFDVNKFLHA